MMENEASGDVFQERLLRARQVRGLSQGDLAKRAGLPPSSISHFESGNRRPSFDNLRRLATALDVTTDFLLGRTDEIGAPGTAQKLHRNLDRLSRQDLQLADRFIRMLAEKDEDRDGDDS